MGSDVNAIHQFAEVGGIHAEVGSQIFLRDHIEEVGTSFDKGFETGFYVKGHEFMLPLYDSHEELFCSFSEKGFNGTMQLKEFLVFLVGDAKEFTVSKGFQIIARGSLGKK